MESFWKIICDTKQFFFDLDGTLVPAYTDRPLKSVIEAVKKAKDKIYISFATGRYLANTKPIVDLLGLTTPCVIANGIQIYDPESDKIICEYELDQELIPIVHKTLQKYKLKIFRFDGKSVYVFNSLVKKKKVLSLYVDLVSSEITDKIINELSHYSALTAHKMIAWQRDDPTLTSLEICSSQATKLHGIQTVAEILNISTKQIIGVGDSDNDFPLLMVCGLKIAMGNAVDELKAIADFVVPSVEEDGAATVIEKFILNQ